MTPEQRKARRQELAAMKKAAEEAKKNQRMVLPQAPTPQEVLAAAQWSGQHAQAMVAQAQASAPTAKVA